MYVSFFRHWLFASTVNSLMLVVKQIPPCVDNRNNIIITSNRKLETNIIRISCVHNWNIFCSINTCTSRNWDLQLQSHLSRQAFIQIIEAYLFRNSEKYQVLYYFFLSKIKLVFSSEYISFSGALCINILLKLII